MGVKIARITPKKRGLEALVTTNAIQKALEKEVETEEAVEVTEVTEREAVEVTENLGEEKKEGVEKPEISSSEGE